MPPNLCVLRTRAKLRTADAGRLSNDRSWPLAGAHLREGQPSVTKTSRFAHKRLNHW